MFKLLGIYIIAVFAFVIDIKCQEDQVLCDDKATTNTIVVSIGDLFHAKNKEVMDEYTIERVMPEPLGK